MASLLNRLTDIKVGLMGKPKKKQVKYTCSKCKYYPCHLITRYNEGSMFKVCPALTKDLDDKDRRLSRIKK